MTKGLFSRLIRITKEGRGRLRSRGEFLLFTLISYIKSADLMRRISRQREILRQIYNSCRFAPLDSRELKLYYSLG